MTAGFERFLGQDEGEALGRLEGQIVKPFAAIGPLLEVSFPLAATRRDVQHGLGVIPTGYQVIAEEGGAVRAHDLINWTPELAFLEADTANTRARLRFVVTPEDPTDA